MYFRTDKKAIKDDNENDDVVADGFEQPDAGKSKIDDSKRGRGRPRSSKFNTKKKSKMSLNLNGLDMLHAHTVRSTTEKDSQQSPAPGCIDQKLHSPVKEKVPLITSQRFNQEPKEKFIPDTNLALQSLLDGFKQQYLSMVSYMATPQYRQSIIEEVNQAKEKNARLLSRVSLLDGQVKNLVDDSVSLLKTRMTELGFKAESPTDLLSKAKEIVMRHGELRTQASVLQDQVSHLETEQNKIMLNREKIIHKYNTKMAPIHHQIPTNEVSPDKLLHDISSVLSQRKKLHNQVQKLETEVQTLENAAVTTQEKAIPCAPIDKNPRCPPSNDVSDQQPPKSSHSMPNFEDRIKSIITSALKEDSSKDEGQPKVILQDNPSRGQVEAMKAPEEPPKVAKTKSKMVSEMTNGNFYAPVGHMAPPAGADEKQKAAKMASMCDGDKPADGSSPSDKGAKSNGLILKLGSLIQSASSGSSPKYETEVTGKNKRSKRKKSSPYHHHSSPPKRPSYMDDSSDLQVAVSSAASCGGTSVIMQSSGAFVAGSGPDGCTTEPIPKEGALEIDERTDAEKKKAEGAEQVCQNYLPRKNWQAKINSGFDKLVALASNHLDKNKDKAKKVHEAAQYKQSPVEKTWVVDTVKSADGTSSNNKENTLSLKFKVVHTSPARDTETPEYKLTESDGANSESQQNVKKGPKTPPDTPPRTPTPSSTESPLRPTTPQVSASPRDSPLIRTTRSRSRSNDSRGSSQASQSPSPAPLPPPAPLPVAVSESNTPNVGKTRTDHCFKKKFLFRDKTWHNHSISSASTTNVPTAAVPTKYQGKFRPKGKNWEIPSQNAPVMPPMEDDSGSHHSFAVPPPNFGPMSLPIGLPEMGLAPPPNMGRNLALGSFLPADMQGLTKQALSTADLTPTVSLQQTSMAYYRESQQHESGAQQDSNRPNQASARLGVANPQSLASSNKRFQVRPPRFIS